MAAIYTGRMTLEFDLDAWDEDEAQSAMQYIADEITRRLRDTALTLTEPQVVEEEINVSSALAGSDK